MPLPTYGYQCTQCQHEFSVFQNMKDDPIRVCPECTGAVKRLLYPVGIVFKGSGWYINDSRKPETSESAEKTTEAIDKTDKADKPDGTSKADKSDKSDTPSKTDKTSGDTASSTKATPGATT